MRTEIPAVAQVLPGRTLDANTQFFAREGGSVCAMGAGVDCFGNVAISDSLAVYAAGLYEASAARSAAERRAAKAETEAKAKAEAAGNAEQRARSAEGRVASLEERLREVEYRAGDAERCRDDLDDIRTQIANVLAICGRSRAKAARAVEAVLGSFEGDDDEE